MRVMIKTTASVVARGIPLSIENSLAVENPPQVYDVYIDQDRGGPNVATIATGQPSWHGTAPMPLYIKGPVDIGKLVMEQNPGAKINNEDQVRIFVAENTGIYGSTRPNTELFSAEAINKAGINLGATSDNAWKFLISGVVTAGVGATPLWMYQKTHSRDGHLTLSEDVYIPMKGCYGRFRFLAWALHCNSCSVRWITYNADGSIANDQTYNYNGRNVDNHELVILKGQYVRYILNYVPGNIDSKNNGYITVGMYGHNNDISPAMLISGNYFNNTNTIQLFNQGGIIGFGGDAIYNAYQNNISDLWQTEAVPQTNETHQRKYNGGDAVAFCDVRQLIVQNSGAVYGGGGGGGYKTERASANATYYRPGGGGAPNGRGGVDWDRHAANGGIAPIVQGNPAGLGIAGANGYVNGGRGGNMGQAGEGGSLSPSVAGVAFRGTPSLISWSNNGTVVGFDPYV